MTPQGSQISLFGIVIKIFLIVIGILFFPLGIFFLYKKRTHKPKAIFIYSNEYIKNLNNQEPSYKWDYLKEEWVKE